MIVKIKSEITCIGCIFNDPEGCKKPTDLEPCCYELGETYIYKEQENGKD